MSDNYLFDRNDFRENRNQNNINFEASIDETISDEEDSSDSSDINDRPISK